MFSLPLNSSATVFKFQPEPQLGIGLHFPSENHEPFVRPNLLAKEYFFTFAEDEFFSVLLGLKVLGLGAQVDTSGDIRPVLSPVCAYLFDICVGPDLIFQKLNKIDFGLSFSLRFF